jgi:hypothetical protein
LQSAESDAFIVRIKDSIVPCVHEQSALWRSAGEIHTSLQKLILVN